MGRMRAVFKADTAETDSRYSVSEWWLEPNTVGPGTHAHPEDHLFYVTARADSSVLTSAGVLSGKCPILCDGLQRIPWGMPPLRK